MPKRVNHPPVDRTLKVMTTAAVSGSTAATVPSRCHGDVLMQNLEVQMAVLVG
jgi:hypothetical protein